MHPQIPVISLSCLNTNVGGTSGPVTTGVRGWGKAYHDVLENEVNVLTSPTRLSIRGCIKLLRQHHSLKTKTLL